MSVHSNDKLTKFDLRAFAELRLSLSSTMTLAKLQRSKMEFDKFPFTKGFALALV